MRISPITFHGLMLSLLSVSAMAADTTDDPALEEVMVQGRQGDYSVITENAQKIIDVPGALGDPLMAVFSLPGVISAGEAGGEPAVRG